MNSGRRSGTTTEGWCKVPFNRPTRDALVQRAVADMDSELQNGAAFIRRTFERAVAIVSAGMSDSQHAHIAYAARQLIIDTADDEILVRWADIFMGPNARKAAQKAEFSVLFTGTAGSTVPANTNLTRSDGATFETLALATIPAVPPFEISATVRAIETGDEGNTTPGTVLAFESTPPAGIDGDVTVEGSGSDPLGGGADIERIEDLRARLLEWLQDPPEGGGAGDYERWAKEVAGVTRAWELPLQYGPSTVLVLFVQDTFDADGNYSGTIFPDATSVQEVYDYIAALAPVTVALQGLFVESPVALPMNPTIAISPNNATVQAQVTQQLQDLVLREGAPDGTLRISQIREAISLAADEDYHDLVSPVADIVSGANQLHTVGTITFQDA